MGTAVTTVIDREKCIGCGACVENCPDRTLSLVDGKAAVTGEESLNCGHCAAICPTGAATVAGIDPESWRFKTFESGTEWLAHGGADPGELVRLMASRRSCRKYTDQPVATDLLDDLVKIGTTAPSGTNSQLWTFTIVPDRPSVEALADRVGKYFGVLNKQAEQAWLRKLLKLIGKPELEFYYENYYESVQEAMAERAENGTDRLFHGAPAAILAGSRPGASCPSEDALLASQNILLGAHALGLGTCLIGFAVSAMERDKGIQRMVGIPDNERIYAVIGLGYPDEKYHRVTGRKRLTPRYFVAK